MAEVLLNNITKTYADGSDPAVTRINFTVRDGEFVVLVGPSGCGKSTLLRLVAGLETVSSGEIFIDGKRVNDLPARDRDIAMVFQNYALYPHMSVFDNMAFGLRMRKESKKEIAGRVHEAARLLGLSELLKRKPQELSGGQVQRVAVGRAIVRRPKIFLFDEPLSNLDAKLRVSMRAEIIKLHKRLGATMIYVTHDQLEAMSMGDRLLVLNRGEVQQTGQPLEIYNRPANRFVAGFIGSPPMNFINCSLIKKDKGYLLQNGSFSVKATEKMEKSIAHLEAENKQVVLGIRPEDIFEQTVSERPRTGCPGVSATILFVEPVGNEVLATCRMGDCEAVIRLSAQTGLAADMTACFSLFMDRAKLFDAETGAVLC